MSVAQPKLWIAKQNINSGLQNLQRRKVNQKQKLAPYYVKWSIGRTFTGYFLVQSEQVFHSMESIIMIGLCTRSMCIWARLTVKDHFDSEASYRLIQSDFSYIESACTGGNPCTERGGGSFVCSTGWEIFACLVVVVVFLNVIAWCCRSLCFISLPLCFYLNRIKAFLKLF